MNYKRIYNNLIKTRKNRVLDENEYYEKHHVIPKSLGGSNKKENLVYLTAREHYIAHWLLYKIQTVKVPKYKMACAWFKMCMPNNKNQIERNFTSKQYERAKKIISKETSKRLKGHKTSNKTKRKISKSLKGHQVSDETRKKQSISQKNRTPLSKKSRKKQSKSLKENHFLKKMSKEDKEEWLNNNLRGKNHWNYGNKGYKLSEKHKNKISDKLKGKNTKEYIIISPEGNKYNIIGYLRPYFKENFNTDVRTAKKKGWKIYGKKSIQNDI
jgi:hypothetical protein